MSVVAPLWLAAAAVIGLGVVVAHLLSTNVPPGDLLPTVRFVPEGAPMTVLRTRRLSDFWLLLLRLLAVALLGLAFAGVRVRRATPTRVVLLDVSRAVGSPAAARDSAVAAASGGAPVIAFDSAARPVTLEAVRGHATGTARGPLPSSRARGSLSAGIAAAHRVVAATTAGRERTELVIVSPLVREEIDSATSRLMALWDGPVRVVRVAAARDTGLQSWDIRADGDDPVAAALAAMPRRRAVASVRILRTSPTRADSQWAERSGGALVIWPAANAGQFLLSRAAADSQSGIATMRQVSIAQFRRELQPRTGPALVRWTDGEPAATERPLGLGCVREVAVPVDVVGDLALRDGFRGIVRSLLAPCGGARDFTPVGSDLWATSNQRLTTHSPQLTANRSQSLSLWLALVALGVLVLEQMLRTRRRAAA